MSFNATTDASVPPSPYELSTVITDDQMIDLVNQVFLQDTVNAAHLRHYAYISSNITRLKRELDHHYEEQREVYDHMMNSEEFRKQIQPVIHTYRRRERNRFHPYLSRPLINRTPTPHPSPPTSAPSSDNSNHSKSTKYYSPEQSISQQEGTSRNPIVIEDSDEEEEEAPSPPDRLEPRFHPICERCHQIGHDKDNCDTPI